MLVLFTVASGALLAAGSKVNGLLVINAVLGTALVAGGASALNMLIERKRDARMRRTENRPLPAGRLQPLEVLLFGLALGIIGVVYLALALPTPYAAIVAAITFIWYVCLYTPLKPYTTLNTLVGAVPGALPPVIGYVAARGSVTMETLALFLIVFVWQLPHFLAIAWIYRDDYARAGHRMVPVVDPDGRRTGFQMIAYCLLLLPVSLMPLGLNVAHSFYLVGALLLGFAFLRSAWVFSRLRSVAAARSVLRLSLVYLPGLLVVLMLDGAIHWLLS